MNGHYTSHYLAEILRDLYFEESTGTIEIRNPNGRSVSLHFDRGMLYFAQSDDARDSFEACLTACGSLPAASLSKLKSASSSSLDMATRLVGAKILSREEIAPAVRSLVEGCVARAFSWPSGSYEFTSHEVDQCFFEPDILFTFECILKGIGKMAHFGPLKDVLLRLSGRVRLSQTLFPPVQKLALKPHHGYILSRIDGSMRLDEIALVLPAGEEDESLQFAYGLAVLGLAEFVPPVNQGPFSLREVMQGHHEVSAREERDTTSIKETAARIAGQASAEILGLTPDADRLQVQKAFDQARARFRRDRFTERVRERCKKELTFIENKLAEAFLKMQVERLERAGAVRCGSAVSEINTDELMVRREMVKTEAQATQEQNVKLADKYYQKAREYFLEKDFHNCIQFCQLAIKFHSDSAAVYALMAEAFAKNPHSRWQKLAEEALQRACDLDPWNAEYHVTLGQFYQDQGMSLRARKQFEKALEILPSHAAAKAALKSSRR